MISDILVKLYNAVIYPFLTYGLIFWGNTYSSTTHHLFILQKRAIRVMTFSKFHEYSGPIFKCLNIVKLPDLVFLDIQSLWINFAIDVYHLCVILSLHKSIRHNYNTSSASSMFYTLSEVRTNYGIYNIRFKGPKVWNSSSENLKTFFFFFLL